MSKIKSSERIIEKIKSMIHSPSFMESNRMSETDFTRERKLPFLSVILFHLNLIKQSLQKELTDFMGIFHRENVSKSAFCQQRLKLKPEAFVQLNEVLVREFYTDNIIWDWNGFRLCSMDGSTLELPKSEDTLNTFGYIESEKIVPMARISTFYDLLNNIIIDSKIDSYETSEYALALEHTKKAEKNDLFILDRGYGAIWLFLYFTIKDINFVTRLQRNFIPEIDMFWTSGEKSKIITINYCPGKSEKKLNDLKLAFEPFNLRLVKVFLDNGQIEVLATSLLVEDKYPISIFKELYFKRWGIEVNYDHLKNHVEIGNFTGKSAIAIQQDFYANMFIANLQAIIARDVQKDIENKKRKAKYAYKVNRNISLGFMKDRIVQILTSNNPGYMEELKQLFKIEPVPIRKNRTFPRQEERKRKKYHMNKKGVV